MSILVTGGTGKTSIRVARLLQNANIPYLIASRRGGAGAPAGMPAAKFDYLDESTFANPFQHEVHAKQGISAVYLVPPQTDKPVPSMNAFIDYARKQGVKRFVLVSSTGVELGTDYYVSKVWQHLIDTGSEYAVLKPSWFMENFTEWFQFAPIKNESKIYSAAEDGKIPFVSADDIAQVAFRTLTDKTPHNKGYWMLGPELFTHDEIAAKLSSGLGRNITHVRQSQNDRTQGLQKIGEHEMMAGFLAWLETIAATGEQERMFDDIAQVLGRAPKTFDQFVQENKGLW